MAASKDQVFLVQGQMAQMRDGAKIILPEIRQWVIVAPNAEIMTQMVSETLPELGMVGYATLKEYEETAAKLRATLRGVDTGWKMVVAPELI